MKEHVLVVGGAGYVGSHMVKCLLAAGESVVTLDNLSTGHRDAVPGGEFVHGDMNNGALLSDILGRYRVDTVMHFASSAQAGESVMHPARYYANNLSNTIALLNAMASRHGAANFVFSSSAAIFGEPRATPVDERHPPMPVNAYGRSMAMIEQLLPDYERAYHLRHVCLRYFNAAGADPAGDLGERHNPETHLIPLALRVARGQLGVLRIFGNDYATEDGTCVRDYVHVNDLCDAHLRAVRYLRDGGKSVRLNLGSGVGYSVRQVVRTVEEVTGVSLRIEEVSRRDGDCACLVVDPARARSVLGWSPRADLEQMVRDAWGGERAPRRAPVAAEHNVVLFQ